MVGDGGLEGAIVLLGLLGRVVAWGGVAVGDGGEEVRADGLGRGKGCDVFKVEDGAGEGGAAGGLECVDFYLASDEYLLVCANVFEGGAGFSPSFACEAGGFVAAVVDVYHDGGAVELFTGGGVHLSGAVYGFTDDGEA